MTIKKPKKKSIEDIYKTLDQVTHILLRPGMYVGSTEDAEHESWFLNGDKFARSTEVVNPALVKIFDEIVSNSVDEHKRNKSLNTIKVNVDKDTGEISIWDNGGIPVVKHKVTKLYVPEMIFSSLLTGSNFNDKEDREGTGTNGVGSTLTNIFSNKFRVVTCDGKKRYIQNFSDNMSKRDKAKITTSTVKHTEITFTPDYDRLNTSLEGGNFKELERRVYAIAGCNPNIRVHFNGELIKIKTFKDYINLYDDSYVYEDNDKWRVAIGKTSGGFQHVSFVNGAETTDSNSTHVKYITDQIEGKLREFFKKKHKVDVKPSDIKAHIRLYIDATIINPKYHSQTKEKLITESKNFKTSIQLSDRFIRTLLKSDIIERILNWVEAKKLAAQRASLKKMNSSKTPRFEGYLPPIGEMNNLFICEGQSAIGGITGALGRKGNGFFPLRGKPKNVHEAKLPVIIANKEINGLVNVANLDFSDPSSTRMSYNNIILATDMDLDGVCIRGLLIAMFHRFCPELIKAGRIKFLRTPLMIAYKNNKILAYFFTLEEYHKFDKANKLTGVTYNYYKGLGTHDDESLREIFEKAGLETFIETIEWDDDASETLDNWLCKGNADKRKELLEGMSFNLDNL
jgi:DNA topoisomerase-2